MLLLCSFVRIHYDLLIKTLYCGSYFDLKTQLFHQIVSFENIARIKNVNEQALIKQIHCHNTLTKNLLLPPHLALTHQTPLVHHPQLADPLSNITAVKY